MRRQLEDVVREKLLKGIPMLGFDDVVSLVAAGIDEAFIVRERTVGSPVEQ
jgi:hypothetical protein